MQEQREGQAGRFEVTAYAALCVLLLPVTIALFVYIVVSAVLMIVWIGIPMLWLGLVVLRWLANQCRAESDRILGVRTPSQYLPLTGGWFARFRTMLADPMTWRDELWLLWSMTLGFTLSLLVLVKFVAVVTLPLWWFGAVPVMAARASGDRAILTYGRTEALERRVRTLAESRAGVVDHSATELRRIERDLHDGPQARLAALSLSLGMADEMLDTDPDAARKLINEARNNSTSALGELRDLVRGIHPPVLADRGLPGAVAALAADMAVPVELAVDIGGEGPEPVESAVYFAIAECLANIGKHSGARNAWVTVRHDGRALTAVVGDDGGGSADPSSGTGLRGIAERLAAFDGTMGLSSPPGGPTIVQLEVPCALSSPKTTRSSGPA